MRNNTKGIVLAGGNGTRLYPLTMAVSKQLLPVYDKPMIFYPLSILMLAGIREILIISTPHDLPNFKKLLRDGKDYGIKLSYKEQPSPDGLAQAFIIGEKFIGKSNVAMILGDNIFYGQGLTKILKQATNKKNGATIFGFQVSDPKRFGVIEFDKKGKVISVEEKPKIPKTNYAQTGLYFFDNRAAKLAKQVKPSARGELEVTSISEMYLNEDKLDAKLLGKDFIWFDTGNIESLVKANNFVKATEEKTGVKIAALEEIAYYNGWIKKATLIKMAERYGKSEYGAYLKKIAGGQIKR